MFWCGFRFGLSNLCLLGFMVCLRLGVLFGFGWCSVLKFAYLMRFMGGFLVGGVDDLVLRTIARFVGSVLCFI